MATDSASPVRLQGTVAAYDEATRGGRVLLDDGVALDLPAGALAPSDARRLHTGQRVVVDVDATTLQASRVRLSALAAASPARDDGPPPRGASRRSSRRDVSG